MVALLLVGGMGTRLWPLTKVTNKHLLAMGAMINRVKHKLAKVGKRIGAVMLDWPIQLILHNKVKIVHVVTGGEHMSSVGRYLSSGRNYPFVPPGCPKPDFFTRNQDEAKGIADAVRQLEGVIPNDAVVLVILGDNVFLGDGMHHIVDDFISERGGRGARVFGYRVKDWHKFGVAVMDDQGKVLKIVEKPKKFIGDTILTGVYLYEAAKLFKVIRKLKPSKRGEYEISEVNQAFLDMGELDLKMVDGPWLDMGDSLETYERASFILGKVSQGVSFERASKLYDMVKSKQLKAA